MVDSPAENLIVTAAHCLDGGAAGVTFVPGYHSGRAPQKSWRLQRVYRSTSWTARKDPDSDVAFATTAPNGGAEVQRAPCRAEKLTTRPIVGNSVTLVGYPDGGSAPTVCADVVTARSQTQLRIVWAGYPDGTSGSPRISEDGRVAGVIGGYQRGGNSPDVSYSPVFGPQVLAHYQAATA